MRESGRAAGRRIGNGPRPAGLGRGSSPRHARCSGSLRRLREENDMPTNVRHRLEAMLRRRRDVLLREATERETALRAIGAEGESELEDAAQDSQMDRILGRLDDRERREIVDINAALDRLASETYGRCTRCREPIELDRMAA